MMQMCIMTVRYDFSHRAASIVATQVSHCALSCLFTVTDGDSNAQLLVIMRMHSEVGHSTVGDSLGNDFTC